jgi:hypothetical protein
MCIYCSFKVLAERKVIVVSMVVLVLPVYLVNTYSIFGKIICLLIFKPIGASGQKGDCIQPQPIISRPGIKGEPGLAGLPGNKIGFQGFLLCFFLFIYKGLPGLQGPPGKFIISVFLDLLCIYLIRSTWSTRRKWSTRPTRSTRFTRLCWT